MFLTLLFQLLKVLEEDSSTNTHLVNVSMLTEISARDHRRTGNCPPCWLCLEPLNLLPSSPKNVSTSGLVLGVFSHLSTVGTSSGLRLLALILCFLSFIVFYKFRFICFYLLRFYWVLAVTTSELWERFTYPALTHPRVELCTYTPF